MISDILQHFNGAVKKGKRQLIQSTFPIKINHKLLKINIYQKKSWGKIILMSMYVHCTIIQEIILP